FGQLIILIVFVPILALTGIEGKMFRPMAATFCFALIAAFLLAFSVIPALAGLLLIGKPQPPNSQRFNLMSTLQQAYAATLKLALRFQRIVLTLAIILLVTGAMLYARLGGEFIPRLYEGAAAFQFVRPLSISMDASIALEKKSQQLLLEFPEVDRVFARIGTAEIATDAMGVNLADTYIMFRPRSEWPAIDGARRTPSELIAALRSHLEAHIPGQRILVSQPIQLRFNELLEGARADVNLKIFGEDLDVLQALTRDATRIISAIPGAGEVEPELRGKVPMLVVTPRDAVLREMGLSRAELLDTIEIGMGGKQVGFLYRGLKRFPIYVRLSTERRGDLEKLRRLPVGVEENFTVPLERLATIEFRETYEMIKRDSFRRRGAVLINPRGRDTESLVNAARERIESELDVPPDYYLEWGGNFKNLEQARLTLASLVVLAFLIVLGMIYSVFQDWRRTGLVLLGVPFALVGGVLSLQLYSIPFSVSAGVGFIALFGISILNGIVLMSHYGDMKSAGLAGRELAIQGGIHRLRPVLMTALTDALGFLPMMTATGLGAGVQRPLATVVVGGVMTSTFVILILLPVLHCMFERYLYTDQRNDPLK
ncbi:MAG: efflux RND transporter permease subunit, partial [Leptospiraceae bacterium]|nr:efflux RND transporter permease subunit [Leptospiraceae bacterium]